MTSPAERILSDVRDLTPSLAERAAENETARRLRDIHTVTQHASVQENVFANAGAERLGRPGPFGP